MSSSSTGPLAGVRVLEVGGMGPVPFAGMSLADMGADVIRVERPGGLGVFPGDPADDVMNRGKRSVVLDLKHPDAREALLTLVEQSDVLIEGGRPGVAERLGYGPDACLARRPALVYGRMTGWGQTGPLALSAGHDVNYIALTGALHAIGTPERPIIPVNLVGDFGGGAMYLLTGVLAALLESRLRGVGQVVDASIVDGVSHLLAATHSMMNAGVWKDERAANPLDGGAPYYAVYRTSDDEFMAVGAYEEKFYRELIAGLGLDPGALPDRDDPAQWGELGRRLQAAFATRTRAEWEQVFLGTDACVSPVRSLREAASDPQVAARGAVRMQGGYIQPGVAPRFLAHPGAGERPRARPVGADTRRVLADAGLDVEALLASGAAEA